MSSLHCPLMKQDTPGDLGSGAGRAVLPAPGGHRGVRRRFAAATSLPLSASTIGPGGQQRSPLSGDGPIAVSGDKRSQQGYLFIRDGQAGLIAPAGAFIASSVHLHIAPVETPPGLPPEFTSDGHAYQITASSQGGVRLAGTISVVLKYPQPPPAVFHYQNGRWRHLCYSDQATFSPTSITCPASSLGIFVAVAYPRLGTHSVPATPLSSTRWAFLNQYLALIAALAVLVVAAVLGYVVSRPDKKPTGRKPRS